MARLPYRHVARGLVTCAGDVLLVEHEVSGGTVWACPGGAVKAGESLHEALARELQEEIGFGLVGEPAEVMVQTTDVPELEPTGFAGVVTHWCVVAVGDRFGPVPGVPDNHEGHPRAEGIVACRWWPAEEVAEATRDHTAVFSPRDMASSLLRLLAHEAGTPLLERAVVYDGYGA